MKVRRSHPQWPTVDGVARPISATLSFETTVLEHVGPLAHYQRLGFAIRVYEGGGYGFATRDDVEIHLGVVPAGERVINSAYLFVADADELAAAWRSAGVEVHAPVDTEWGQHEGAVVDPDGNVIRFGSPMPPTLQE